jgi:hypothetical protein
MLLVHEGCIGSHGRTGIADGGEILILNLNELGGGIGSGLGFGYD